MSVWATGKRADHTITNITNIVAYRNQLKIVILRRSFKVFLLPKNSKNGTQQNTIISLIPLEK
jgi:thiamine pyrophosphokinase